MINPHQKHPLSPVSLAHSIKTNWFLIWQMGKREVAGRYRGSVMGLLWTFLNPIIMLAIYTFVFGVVFKSKWGASSVQQNRAEFAVGLFAGLIIFGFFSECINRAPSLVISNPSYVKKIAFPLESLVPVMLVSAFFHLVASFTVLLTFYLIAYRTMHLTVLLAPVVFLPLLIMTAGFAWFLASLGVFLRDIGQMIGFVVTIIMFTSPIFYPASALPPRFRMVMLLNPIAEIVEQFRAVIIGGQVPDFGMLGIYTVVAVCICWLGYAWFQKTRKAFADVI
jgi:lipopolysaccharide transport system permease protein